MWHHSGTAAYGWGNRQIPLPPRGTKEREPRSSGKIEVVGKSDGFVYMTYHRAPNPADNGRFLVFKSNPEAHWFDDYAEAKVICADGPKGMRAAAAQRDPAGVVVRSH